MIQTLAQALEERGYDALTEVQQAVTAPGLEGSDLLVSAQTGSGKTVAFGLAIAPTLLGEGGAFGPAGAPLALVVAPTRELAMQVMRELTWLYGKAGVRVASCVGGMDMREERRALERGAHIVVGTPGRLRDHITRGSLALGEVRAVVLDEADEMLDLGFREDLEFMLAEAPEGRRTLMFSATVPAPILKLAGTYLRDPVRIAATSGGGQHADIAYQAMRVAPTDAENAIINVLRFHEAAGAIVFANTRAAVSRLGARLTNRGLSVVTLSGELSQGVRTHALQAMRDGRARVCVATDVAARGIDLPNLELVVHAELPTNAETLLHRSGRTGRAGRKGTSILIVPPRAERKARGLLSAAKLDASWTAPPSAEEILRRDEERLLADPVWTAETTEEEAAFAARLMAQHPPERIAAAYLRLHRERHSAPEELAPVGAPDERPAKAPRERGEFGPSRWFALSVGHDRRAEARWLLPLILRVGKLDKNAIGAIRVRPTETFVQIVEGEADKLMAALGEGGRLEEGIEVRALAEPPDLTARPAPKPRPGRPRDAGPPPRGPRILASEAPAPAAEEGAPEGPKPKRKPRAEPDAEAVTPKKGRAGARETFAPRVRPTTHRKGPRPGGTGATPRPGRGKR